MHNRGIASLRKNVDFNRCQERDLFETIEVRESNKSELKNVFFLRERKTEKE